jgi:hypothetical protein
MIDLDLVRNLCSSHSKAIIILKKANGKRHYTEIANLVQVHPTLVSNVLSKAKTFGLVTKKGKYYARTQEFRHIDVDKLLSRTTVIPAEEKAIRTKKPKKIIATAKIKEEITDYLCENFQSIQHPYSDSKSKLPRAHLAKAASQLFQYLEEDVAVEQLEGIAIRFYDAFAEYYSCNRMNKAELINSFSLLIKCFEPYVKKVAVVKTGDPKNGGSSLDGELISKVVSFSSIIKKSEPDYWKDKPIHEASIRTVYPFRHKEAHEARDYPSFEIERIVYYMLASLIFINLNY